MADGARGILPGDHGSGVRRVKTREPRLNVVIKARMRVGASWGDVSILNISSRGLLIHSPQAPPQGSYLEVRRGRHAIIARVVWSQNQRFGVRTQDPLSIEAIIREPDRSAPEARRAEESTAPVERRGDDLRARSSKERHERSRMFGRAFEFACIAAAGISAALVVHGIVAESLGRPLADVGAALTAR